MVMKGRPLSKKEREEIKAHSKGLMQKFISRARVANKMGRSVGGGRRTNWPQQIYPGGALANLYQAPTRRMGPTEGFDPSKPPPFDRTEPNPGMPRRIASGIHESPPAPLDWSKRKNLPNPGPDSPLAPPSILQEPFLEERRQRVEGIGLRPSGILGKLPTEYRNKNGKKNGNKK